MTRTLAIFAKEPRAGHVKTRLAAETSPQWAAEVYEACLLDLLDRVQSLAVRRVLVVDPPDSLTYFETARRDRYAIIPQVGDSLGQRLHHFFAEEFAAGAKAIVAIGTDSPTLPPELIAQAFAELARSDVVLGPCTDGGYYLIGCRRLIPVLFTGIDWSTPRVLEQTIRQIQHAAGSLALLPPWYDVDTLADWQCLKGHLAAMLRAGIDPGLPRVLSMIVAAAKK